MHPLRFHTFEQLRRAAENRRDHAATHAALQAEGRRPPSYSDGRVPAAEKPNKLPHSMRHRDPQSGNWRGCDSADCQRLLTLPRAPDSHHKLSPERRAAALELSRAVAPAAAAVIDSRDAEHAQLCAVRSQYVCIGADSTGARVFCHVLDAPDPWIAALSPADYRALRTARHRAQQQPRVEFDAAAFPALVTNGVFAQDARLGTWGTDLSAKAKAETRSQIGRAAMGADPLAFVAGPDRVAPWRKLQPASASAMPSLLERPARVR